MEFLVDELSGLPPSATKAILSELESVVRSARYMAASEQSAVDYDLQCQRACARIAATLQFATRLKELLSKQDSAKNSV